MPDDAVRCPLASQEPELLLEWAARRLSDSQTAALDRHFALCPECRAFADAQRQVWSALDDWEPEAAALDFQQKLFERIEKDQRLRPKLAVPAAALAAALLLVLLAPLNAPPALDPPPAVVLETLEQQAADLDMLAQWPPAAAPAHE